MGLYDTIHINEKIPLPGFPDDRGRQFQTKDLGRPGMNHYEVDEKGRFKSKVFMGPPSSGTPADALLDEAPQYKGRRVVKILDYDTETKASWKYELLFSRPWSNRKNEDRYRLCSVIELGKEVSTWRLWHLYGED